MVPLCSCVRVQRLQGIASASNLPSTDWAACLLLASSMIRSCRPAVLLSCWAFGAEPMYLLVAAQGYVVRILVLGSVLLMIPLRQKSSCIRILALSKGWAFDELCTPCKPADASWAASVSIDPILDLHPPFVSTSITEPSNGLSAVRNHTVGSNIIFLVVPLSCNSRSFGRQRVVLAYLVAAALRTTFATRPAVYNCCPAVQVAIWTLITCPPNHLSAEWFDDYVAKVSISNMIPLLL